MNHIEVYLNDEETFTGISGCRFWNPKKRKSVSIETVLQILKNAEADLQGWASDAILHDDKNHPTLKTLREIRDIFDDLGI